MKQVRVILAARRADVLEVNNRSSHDGALELIQCSSTASSRYPTDAFLLSLIESGDEDAMAHLYDAHARRVYSVALGVLRDPAAAEDVVQEVFLGVWRKPMTFVPARGSIAAWLAITARNRAIDAMRRRKSTDSIDHIHLCATDDIALRVEESLLLARVQSIITRLPEGQRDALQLAFFRGMTHAEVALHLGVPLGTVKTRIRSALRSLRAGLHPEGPRDLPYQLRKVA